MRDYVIFLILCVLTIVQIARAIEADFEYKEALKEYLEIVRKETKYHG